MSAHPTPERPSTVGEPAWEVATLLPAQGEWTESDFLRLHTNRMAELVGGRLEVLPVPTWLHQLIVKLIVAAIEPHATSAGGVVLFAPLPVRLFPGTIREPDVLYVASDHLPGDGELYPRQIDLAVEVVSSGAAARQRDYEEKRIDYARAGVREYWIVDPDRRVITVLELIDSRYEEYGIFGDGDHATGRLLPELTVDVSLLFAAAKGSIP